MHRLRSLPTPTIIASLIAIDVTLWTSVLPFEIWAHGAALAPHPSIVVLVGILAVNAVFLGAMFLASAMTVELVRRGVTLRRLFPAMRRLAPQEVPVRD